MVRPEEEPEAPQEGAFEIEHEPYPAWHGRVLCIGSALWQYTSVVCTTFCH